MLTLISSIPFHKFTTPLTQTSTNDSPTQNSGSAPLVLPRVEDPTTNEPTTLK